MDNNKEIAKKENSVSALMALISIIPYIGSAINEAVFDRRSRIKQERINSFVTELGKSVSKIDESKIDKSYIQSDEFGDVLESTFKKVSEFGTKTRIIRFKNILLNQVILKYEAPRIETFLSIITTLSEKQLLLLEHYQLNEIKLKNIYKRLEEEEDRGSRFMRHTNKKVTLENADVDELRQLYNNFLKDMYIHSEISEDDDIEFILQDLVSKSLLKDISFTIKNRKPNDILIPTNYSKTFLKFIVNFEE